MLLLSKSSRFWLITLVLVVSSVLLFASWCLVPPGKWTTGLSNTMESLAWQSQGLTPIPTLASSYLQNAPRLTDCVEGLRPPFLQSARNTSVNYCTDASSSQLTCFRTHASSDKTDSACIGTPAVFDSTEMKFKLGCTLRDMTEKEVAAGVPDIAHFPTYWYEVGPRLTLERHVNLVPAENVSFDDDHSPRNYTILVRREAPIDNLWHHLMQIASVFLTLDVLQLVLDPVTDKPFFNPQDIQNTRVVIFDNHDEGPFWDQWSIFANRPLTRVGDLLSDSISASENIIVPLPSVANPIWQDDWVPAMRDCDEANLDLIFSQRMLKFYGISDEAGPLDRPLVLTFVDRVEKRSLIDKEAYINDL